MMNFMDKAKGWTVLIVDDEPDNLGVPNEILSFYGATVYTARDGIEGLNMLERIQPTFILLDLSMPNMDGWEMREAMLQDPRHSSIPVIALTAHAMKADRARAAQAGFNGYIIKPFMLDTFTEEIERCVGELV